MSDVRALAERYRKLYAGVVYDAIAFDFKWAEPFVLSTKIRPLWRFEMPLVGPAFTCRGVVDHKPSEAADKIRIEMLLGMREGDVQMIGSDGSEHHVDRHTAHYGDVSALLALGHGVSGVVVDGYVRDAWRIEQVGNPLICCKGTSPVDAYGIWHIAEWNTPIYVDGQRDMARVKPRQWIFADGDGVLVIPFGLEEQVCKAAEKRADSEERIRGELLAGADPLELYERWGRW